MKNNYTDNLDKNNQLKNVYIFNVLEMEMITYEVNTKFIVSSSQDIQLICVSENYKGFFKNINVSDLNTCNNGCIIATDKNNMMDLFDQNEKYLVELLLRSAKKAANILIGGMKADEE